MARELGAFACHPVDELMNQRCNFPAARGKSLIGRQPVIRSFSHEATVDLAHRLECHGRERRGLGIARLRSNVRQLEELAPRMCPACRLGYPAWFAASFVERAEPGIGVSLQDAAVPGD